MRVWLSFFSFFFFFSTRTYVMHGLVLVLYCIGHVGANKNGVWFLVSYKVFQFHTRNLSTLHNIIGT